MPDRPPQEARPRQSPRHGRGFSLSKCTRAAVGTLYDLLGCGKSSEAVAAFARWRDAGSNRALALERTAGTDALALALGWSPGPRFPTASEYEPARLVFAAQTYFALLAKLLVWQSLAPGRGLPTPGGLADGAGLRSALDELESGHWRGLDVGDVFHRGLFAWYLEAWCGPVESLVRDAAARLGRFAAPGRPAQDDLLHGVYESLFPRRFRHALGEYYTPAWLVRAMLNASGYSGDRAVRLLDPACGAGAFLVEAVRRCRAADAAPADPAKLLDAILANLVGYDANPLAVLAARANYLMAVGDLLPGAGRIEVPVYLRDSILDRPEGVEPFDYVVGNPPWIAWDHLPAAYREATRPLWQRYGLFSLSASDARHGGGKKDLAMLMVYAAADRYLKHGGRLAMIVPQTLFQTRGAGDGFRRFRLGGEGAWLRVVQVDDLVEVHPFDAANWTATVVIEKGLPTVYPVPYAKWTRPAAGRSAGPSAQAPGQDRFDAWPVDPRRPTAPWFLWPSGWTTGDGRNPLEGLVGPSDYTAHLGANSGGANGVYWLSLVDGAGPAAVRVRNLPEQGKRGGAAVEHLVEAELVYPLLRWGDVARFCAAPQAHVLLVQDAQTRRGIDEATMLARYPNAHAYLSRFREVLCRRAAYRRYQERGPFYSMYDVGPYTLAPIKVVWRRMDRRINAAVVEEAFDRRLGPRPVVPQETCVLVAAASSDEAHYLCALLNSAVVGFLASAHGVRGGKGFGTPGMLDHLGLRRFDPARREHRELAGLSRRAHAQTAAGEAVSGILERIDRLAGRLRGLDERLVDRMREA